MLKIAMLVWCGVIIQVNTALGAETVPAPQPVKALLICGGCCHDYDSQKEIIKKGLEQYAHIDVTVVHQGGSGTSAEIELYRDPQWAEPYDVILHDECFADDRDPAWLARILAPHRAGKPGVVIHCAMHCYRVGNDDWFEFCGVTSHGHGPHYPHEVRNVNAQHPIMSGFGAAWANPAGELYRIEKVWDGATPLATAKDRQNGEDQVCVWTNDYKGTRVFGTTLGHHNETVEDPAFISMLARGTLWAAGKLESEYIKPVQPRREQVNLALNKPVTASSEQRDQNNLLAMAVDGKRGTRWCASGGGFPQWCQVDLEAELPVQGVKIEWESDDATYVYRVEGSRDGVSYDPLFSTGDGGVRGNQGEHLWDVTTYRYLRVTCDRASPGAWASIREFKVLGTELREVVSSDVGSQREAELLGECRLPDGFEATLFASPPAVNYPVFVAAAPDGTLFVSSDKNGSLDREPRRGSVIRLRDLDGDGRADESNLFVDNVDSPRGLVWDQDRLYLLHPPHLSAFIDEDGDGVSDRQEILVRDIAFGFKDRPADHTSNGVTMGIDGYLYLAIGDFGFMNAVGSDGRTLQFRGGGVVRVRPDGTGMELYSQGTRNILEVAVDPLLRGFARDNTNDGGGWDVRMHHFTGYEDHGYPRRYINFADEVIAPRADYGGGSGCGALFLDEPGMPDGFSDCAYTADWGRQQIFRHRIHENGSSVDIDQQEFLGIERATDLDVDANSNIFAASWKGATFTYAGEDVGYVVRLTPKGYRSSAIPDWKTADDGEWFAMFNDASHRRRLEAQRVLVRRGLEDAQRGQRIAERMYVLAGDGKASVKSRIAALFGYQQLRGIDSVDGLVRLGSDPVIRPWVIRALGEHTLAWDADVLELLEVAVSDSQTPRGQLEGVIAAARLGMELRRAGDAVTSVALANGMRIRGSLLPLLATGDTVLRHTTVFALAELGGQPEALALLSGAGDTDEGVLLSETHRQGLQQLLQSRHKLDIVQTIINRLQQTRSGRLGLLSALCRLHYQEGEWNGSSWGTRPDTRGPYYQPEAWEGTAVIKEVLQQELAVCDAATGGELLSLMASNRIAIGDYVETWIAKDGWRELPLEVRGEVLQQAGALSATVVEQLVEYVAEGEIDEATRLGMLDVFLGQGGGKGVAGVLALLWQANQDANGEALRVVWQRCVSSSQWPQALPVLLERFEQDREQRETIGLAIAAIVGRQDQENAPQSIDALERLWGDEAAVRGLLGRLRQYGLREGEMLVRRSLVDSRAEVQRLGQDIAEEWQLAGFEQWTGAKIGGLDKEQVIREVVAGSGDSRRGAQVFSLLGCAKCHDVSPSDVLRGPYLPNVAKTYKREQLTEAILLPSKSIAQGFVQNVFLLDDGRTVSGFVTSEGAELITIRNAQGQLIEIEVAAIEQRKESPVSVMPEGLVDAIPVAALSDLVSYLQALGG